VYATNKLTMNTMGIYSGDTVRICNILSAVTAPDSNIIDGAVSISFNRRADIHLKKNTLLDGRNHNINGDLDTLSAPAVPGLTLGSAEDRAFEMDQTVRIMGKGTIDSVAVGGQMPDRTPWIKQLIELADIKITKRKDLDSYTTLGTAAAPKITYVQDYSGYTNFEKNVTGAGILIVEGDVAFKKNFKFTGLVIVMGDNMTESVKFNEDDSDGIYSTIIGSLMVVGEDNAMRTRLYTSKNTKVLYSKEALAYAMANNPASLIARYEITDWSE